MSGEAGDWPIGPAANPAKPAPSVTRLSQFVIGTSLADGLAFISTNCAKKNSMPSSSAFLRITSTSGRVLVVAMVDPFSRTRRTDQDVTNRLAAKGGFSRIRAPARDAAA